MKSKALFLLPFAVSACATVQGGWGGVPSEMVPTIEKGFAAERSARTPADQAEEDAALAEILARSNLPFAASLYDAHALQGGSSRTQLKAVATLADLAPKLNDPYLIPTLLAKKYQQGWQKLPPNTFAEINYLVASTWYRSSKLQEARAALEKVSPKSPVYAKARYLMGVIDADSRQTGPGKLDQALESFDTILKLNDGRQQDLKKVQQLALLGKGRILYGLGRYSNAMAAYDQVPRFSEFWDQALFENAFARFRGENYGAALGALKSLHAPQFEGAFQPESWVLESIVLHFACLFEDSKRSFGEFETEYMPMADKIQPLVDSPKADPGAYVSSISDESTALPKAIRLWIRKNDRVHGLLELISEIDREEKELKSLPGLSSSTVSELTDGLRQNRTVLTQVLGQLVKNRLSEAYQTIRKLHSEGDLIRLETTLAEKQLLEVGTDQRKVLADQKLHRPVVPSDSWNYWQFQGEYWIDEIGYYQYTLKRGCVADSSAAAPQASR